MRFTCSPPSTDRLYRTQGGTAVRLQVGCTVAGAAVRKEVGAPAALLERRAVFWVVIQGSHQLRKLVSSVAVLQNACGQGVLRVDNCTARAEHSST